MIRVFICLPHGAWLLLSCGLWSVIEKAAFVSFKLKEISQMSIFNLKKSVNQ